MSFINMMGLVVCLGGIACHIVHKFSTTKMIQNIPIISDGAMITPTSCEQQLQVNYVNGNVAKQNMKLNSYFSNQHTPLLDSDDDRNSDSDESQEAQNASEVIFDVLKRRDMHR